jgi:hypothetical protein
MINSIIRNKVETLLSNREAILSLDELPSSHRLKEGVLVRFRCMIQDTLDTVMKHKKLGEFDLKYRSGFEGIPQPDSFELSPEFYNVDRYTVVSVPGVPCHEGPSVNSSPFFEEAGYQNKGRTRTVESDSKRQRQMGDDDDPPSLIPLTECKQASTIHSCGRVPAHPVPERLLPRPGVRYSAIAHICDPQASFQLHDVVEIIGIVSRFIADETLPLVDFNIQVIDIQRVSSEPVKTLTSDEVAIARSALKSVLTRICLGDENVAEYILLQLISARIPGNEFLPTMGSWSLNICHAESLQANVLSDFLQKVVPGSMLYIPTTNEILMNENFYPHRAPEDDFTHPGILQLPRGSNIIIDERHLSEGNVNALNVLAINKAVREQELIGVFGSSEFINFPIEASFLILSSGRASSIFGNTNPSCGVNGSVPLVTVPFKPQTTDSFTKIETLLSSSDLKLVRDYLVYCQRSAADVSIPEPIVQIFQDDWVQTRKDDPSVPTEDIHCWATLLRAFPTSLGETTCCVSSWKNVLGLEKERRSRLCLGGATYRGDNCSNVLGA